ncbi:MAG: type 11 methyltransferase [Parcubacteria group bacterium Gr01-1014_33]|nr:MAG: type 11 methyltransferase [Parcubacteria group bacterium Gr01-1014_33]
MEPIIYQGIASIEKKHWWYVGRRRILAILLPRYFISAKDKNDARKILSIGCGTGEELKFLKRYGEVSGVEDNEEAIHFCRLSGVGELVKKASATDLPFSDSFFDVVFALDVLEHVKDEDVALHEMRRVLKSGGILVLTVPAFTSLWSNADIRAHHYRRYHKKGLLHTLLSARFKPLRVNYFNTLLFVPIAILKIWARSSEPKVLDGAEVSMPPTPINTLLTLIFSLEALWMQWFHFPFGISLVAIAEKEHERAAPRREIMFS